LVNARNLNFNSKNDALLWVPIFSCKRMPKLLFYNLQIYSITIEFDKIFM
jgi:hypothetical protein